MVLLLDGRGRNSTWHESEICHALAMDGYKVVSADLRGSGDLRPAYSSGNPAYVGDHQSEDAYAWASLISGQTVARAKSGRYPGVARCVARTSTEDR